MVFDSMLKKLLAVVLSCGMVLPLNGCADKYDFNAMYDNDSEIVAAEDVYSVSIYSFRSDDNGTKIHTGSFVGVKTLWDADVYRDCDIDIIYTLSVRKGGRAKIVLVTPEDEVIILAENTDNTVTDVLETQTVSLGIGYNSIKLVGAESPAIDLVLRVKPTGMW